MFRSSGVISSLRLKPLRRTRVPAIVVVRLPPPTVKVENMLGKFCLVLFLPLPAISMAQPAADAIWFKCAIEYQIKKNDEPARQILGESWYVLDKNNLKLGTYNLKTKIFEMEEGEVEVSEKEVKYNKGESIRGLKAARIITIDRRSLRVWDWYSTNMQGGYDSEGYGACKIVPAQPLAKRQF
jgi:hypothetical protein